MTARPLTTEAIHFQNRPAKCLSGGLDRVSLCYTPNCKNGLSIEGHLVSNQRQD